MKRGMPSGGHHCPTAFIFLVNSHSRKFLFPLTMGLAGRIPAVSLKKGDFNTPSVIQFFKKGKRRLQFYKFPYYNQNHRLSRWYAPRLQGDIAGSPTRALKKIRQLQLFHRPPLKRPHRLSFKKRFVTITFRVLYSLVIFVPPHSCYP